MSDPKYRQDGFEKRLSKLIEECGEVLAAAGKMQRWGPFSENPEIPVADRETNIVWLRREIKDVLEAIRDLDEAMQIDLFCDPLE